ncbi:hypothetical protein MKX03_032945 [Papaver bracteatum]|nr:hypothetical protein MKX03_032945 [Papaver bracteatum]
MEMVESDEEDNSNKVGRKLSINRQSTGINPQGNTVGGNAIFIPRRIPRTVERLQQGELLDFKKERGKKCFHDSVNSVNQSIEKKSQEKRRTAQRARRSAMTKNKRDQILENRRTTYQMKKARVGYASNIKGRASENDRL